MNASISQSQPDFETIKARQQAMWGSGDYASIAALIVYMSERMCEDLDLSAGQSVLDVATGSGNAAIAAARRGARVTGCDYQESLLASARERSRVERVNVTWEPGDAENLPYPDGEFEIVTSVVGVMFAPNQEKAAAELHRVCRSDGKIVTLSWTPEGFIGHLLKTVGAFVAPPAGLRPTVRWGTVQGMTELLGEHCDLSFARHHLVFRFETADALADLFISKYGPTERASESLDPQRRQEFFTALSNLASEWSESGDGTIKIPAEYLQTIARPRA